MSDLSNHSNSGCFALCSLRRTRGRAHDGTHRVTMWEQAAGHPNCSCSQAPSLTITLQILQRTKSLNCVMFAFSCDLLRQ